MERLKKEKETRDALRLLRRHMVEKGMAGCRISPNPIKHKNVSFKDARRNNLVVLDTRTASNTSDCLLGKWESQFQIGILTNRPGKGQEGNKPEDVLTLLMYQPWAVDPSNGLPLEPLWAHIKKQNVLGHEVSTEWIDLVTLPWLPIKEMPLSVCKALAETNGQTFSTPASRLLKNNAWDTGVTTVELKKPGYEDRQLAGTVKYVMQLDGDEKLPSKNGGGIFMNEVTQCDLLYTLIAAKHDHADED